jgi:NAD(P)H-hydrate epimerase
MRGLDRAAIDEFGIVEEFLMENAGLAVYSVILNEFGIKDREFLVFCGIGNNGGDGFVVARNIHSNGGAVKVYILGDPGMFKDAAKINLDIVARLPIEVRRLESIEAIQADITHCDAIVDAIFGTGLTRDVEGLYRDIIELINHSGKTVFSVDIPSGVHGDTGQVMGTAVKADHTVTFGLPKIGNMLFPGYDLCGKLYVSHISFPPSIYDADSLKVEINDPIELSTRHNDARRGDVGAVLFISEAASHLGAPYFAPLSFLKAGGGHCSLAARESTASLIATEGTRLVLVPQKETELGSIAFENKRSLLELSETMDIVVLGPALSLEEETQQLSRELATEIIKPLLLDGDGIMALSSDWQVIRERKAVTVLMADLGTLSRITSIGVRETELNRIEILQRTARELNAIIVLKDIRSLIGYPDGRVFINLSGNPAMAAVGSGDALTGTVAAMFGLGLPAEDAVRKGVFIHGLSGDLAAEDKREDGLTAQDILDYLALAVRMDREGLNEVLIDRYIGAQVV